MAGAAVLLADCSQWVKRVWTHEHKERSTSRLGIFAIPGKVSISKDGQVKVIQWIADIAYLSIFQAAVDVSHQAVQPPIALLCPIMDVGGEVAYWPQQVISGQAGREHVRHEY